VAQAAPTVAAEPTSTVIVPAQQVQPANTAAATQVALHGITIVDNNGALGTPTPSVSTVTVRESVAEASRRAKAKALNQSQSAQTPSSQPSNDGQSH
jgi:hypothetical protein